MPTEKRGLLCEFKPEELKSTPEMREWFTGSYPRFLDDDLLEFKCWFVNQERGTWGALYIWKSAEALDDYVKGDVWNKVVPEKYGCKPTWKVVEVGPIIAKTEIKVAKDSWISE
jgi:hypothetical protein